MESKDREGMECNDSLIPFHSFLIPFHPKGNINIIYVMQLVRSAMMDGNGQAVTSYARNSTPIHEEDELLEELQ